MIQLSSEHEAALRALASEGYNHWKANADAVTKSATDAYMAAIMGDPDKIRAAGEKLQADFEASDANGNGRLDRQEFANFV